MIKLPLFLLITVVCAGCRMIPDRVDPDKITSINIIDRSGMSETISSKDRLNAFENTDFLSPQPYQKVMRVYGREKNGDVRSCITSYHPNGQVKQYLTAINNSASGVYREWYSSGQLKVDTHLIGGIADLNTLAEESWLFDNVSHAWDEESHLIAKIYYNKGELEGESVYYHSNGQVWKQVPFEKNNLHGTQTIFLDDGTLFQTTEFVDGVNDGLSQRYWNSSTIAYQEEFEQGLLMDAQYYASTGELQSEIKNGNGFRALFGKNDLQQLQEYRNGIQKGEVKVYLNEKTLIRLYNVKNGEKEGEEIDYFPGTSQPKLSMSWEAGILNGPVKTWHENGNLESQREISQNKKNGLLTVWYSNGALAFVEEYENDQLIKGEYYRRGEKEPISKVEKGTGVATVFNADGNFSRKIHYQAGTPVE